MPKNYTLLEYLVAIDTELTKLKKVVAESVGADYSELIANINGIRNELNTFKTTITDTVDTNKSDITSKFNSLENQFNTFKTSITNTVNTNNTNITSQVNTLTSQFETFKTSLESQVNGLSNRMTNVEQRVKTLENSGGSGGSSGGNVDLTEVNNRISANENNISTLQTEMTSVKQRVTNLENNQGSTGGSPGGSGEADGYGEKLIVHYIHTGNKEIHFSSFDFATGQGTTTVEHGLINPTIVAVAPNDWTLRNRNGNANAIPVEYSMLTENIKLVPVDTTTLKITKNDGTTPLTVDTNGTANANIDINKFHFEVITPWEISNIPVKTNHIRIIFKGYIKGITNRYMLWKTKNDSDKEVAQNSFQIYASPKPANACHCIFGYHNYELDARDELVLLKYENYFEARANKANFSWQTTKETDYKINSKNNDGKDRISCISSSTTSPFNCNGTHIYIYDLGGSY